MEAWGHVKVLAPGRKRSPDGYVRPGQLALFQPSMKFSLRGAARGLAALAVERQ